jgi:hypothetical protein
MEEIKGQEKFLPIKHNAYRYRIGNAISSPAASFNMQTSIGKHTMVKRISRPDGKVNIDLLRERIISDLENG